MINSSKATNLSKLARFFLANVLGVSIDMAVAIFLINVAGVSTTVATAVSIAVAAFVMYFVHELWTFAGTNDGFSGRRLAAVVASAFIGLATRAAVIFVLQKLPFNSEYIQYMHLLIAVGVSFVVNFLLVKSIIERRAGARPSRSR